MSIFFFPLDINVETFGFYYKSNILHRQRSRPSIPPRLHLSPSQPGRQLGRRSYYTGRRYTDPSRTSVRPRLAASSTIGLPVVAIPTPLPPHLRPFDFFNLTRATGRRLSRPLSYLSTTPPGRQLDHRTTGRRLRRPLSYATNARLFSNRRTSVKVKIKMPTASRIPKRSPIQVLTGPDAA